MNNNNRIQISPKKKISESIVNNNLFYNQINNNNNNCFGNFNLIRIYFFLFF